MTSSTPTRPGQTTLDSSPPPAKGKSTSLMDTQASGKSTPQSPHVATMLGMNMLEQGARLISMSLPELGPGLQQMTMQLRDALAKAMSQSPIGAPQGGMPPPPPGGSAVAAPPPPPGGEMPQQQ